MFLREGISRKVLRNILLRTPTVQLPIHEFQDVLCASPLEIPNIVCKKTGVFNHTHTHRSFNPFSVFHKSKNSIPPVTASASLPVRNNQSPEQSCGTEFTVYTSFLHQSYFANCAFRKLHRNIYTLEHVCTKIRWQNK